MEGMKVAAAIDAAVQWEVGLHEQQHEKMNSVWRKRQMIRLMEQQERECLEWRAERAANRAFTTGNHAGPLGVVVPMPSVSAQNSMSLAEYQQARDDGCLDQLDVIISRQLKQGAIRPETKVTVLVVDPKTLKTRASLCADGASLLTPASADGAAAGCAQSDAAAQVQQGEMPAPMLSGGVLLPSVTPGQSIMMHESKFVPPGQLVFVNMAMAGIGDGVALLKGMGTEAPVPGELKAQGG